ncbi:MAG: anaerobic ribonucleoside-triphosphate reductase activating protein, partial [Clostridia bacterium]|nr:anaerobic ribonucleoside-triphosphate reductase activating protein [Clostridia bacterium]
MRIAGFQKLTLLDFPGKVACTLFTPGCDFRCPFCHNASLVLSPGADEVTEEEIFSFLRKRQGLLEGVAITGGEPLMQPGLDVFIRKVRALGYAVKLDTNGSFPERLAPLLEEGLLDCVAMDIKNSPARYDLATGVKTDLSRIRASVALLIGGRVPYEFRTTVVKGIHRAEDFPEIGRLIEGAARYFLQSYVDSGDVI